MTQSTHSGESQHKAAQSRGEERYQAFIKNSHEGIWRFEVDQPISVALSPNKQIKLMYRFAYLAEANDAMAAMYGVDSPEQLIGLRLTQMLVPSDARNTAYLKAFINADYRLTGVASYEVDCTGQRKVFRNSLVGFVENGYLVRAWGTQQDITQHVANETALRESEERLSLAIKASRLGLWEWNIDGHELLWSDELKAQFGLPPTEKITYAKYIDMVHPEDRERLKAIIWEAAKTGREYSVEHRVIWPDGSVHWLLAHGRAFFKDGGAPVRMLGTSLNIDEPKKAQESARRAERLKAANALLKSQREQLVALNHSKDEFISVASHQLRTPATGVKQYVGMLLQGYSGELSREQREFLEIAYECNERELQIIDDLLNVAKVDAGKITLNKIKTDIVGLVHKVLKDQAPIFASRSQQVNFVQPKKPLHACVDEQYFCMSLDNILNNASKYSLARKTITIRVARKGEHHVSITIKDEGVGIAQKDRQKLFQKFSRIDNSLSTQVGGTGLGLYWAKRIIDLHGGDIMVQSRSDKGSSFMVIVPTCL